MRDGNVTHLEMNGTGESKLIFRLCTMITLKSVIYEVSRSLLPRLNDLEGGDGGKAAPFFTSPLA